MAKKHLTAAAVVLSMVTTAVHVSIAGDPAAAAPKPRPAAPRMAVKNRKAGDKRTPGRTKLPVTNGHTDAAVAPSKPVHRATAVALSTPKTKAAALDATTPTPPKGTGDMRNGTFVGFALTDRISAKVDVGSGDLLVTTNDLSLPAIGTDVTIGAAYNSRLVGTTQETGSLGHGWRTRSAVDVRLIPNSDGSVSYLAADGEYGTFTVSGSGYSAPDEFKMTLAHDGSGWKLTDHGTGAATSFNSAGLPTSVADRNGQKVTYSYNTANQLTSIVSDRGATSVRTANVAYGSSGFIATVTQTGTDGTSRHAAYGYDSAGNLTALTDAGQNSSTLGYDGAHNLTSIATPIGKTTFTYDDDHRVTSMTRWDTTTGNGYVTRFSYDDFRNVVTVADANTDPTKAITAVARTTYQLDDDDPRVKKVLDPAGNSRSKTYTPFGDVATAVGGDGGVTTNTYGSNNGESLTRNANPTGSATSFAYGNAATTANPTAPFQPSSNTDTQGNKTAFTYDGPGNKLTSTSAGSAKAQVAYNSDGTVKSSTDPGNGTNSTTYTYDANKQLTAITPPTGNSLKARNFTYDAYGRLRTGTDGAGHTMTYSYDGDDRVVGIAYSDGRAGVAYRYDRNGNLLNRTDASGTTTYTYDPRNLMTSRVSSTGGGTLTYRYDNVGNLAKVTDGGGSATYAYDSRELLVAMTDRLGNRYSFGYDKQNRRTDTWFNTNSDNSVWAEHTATTYDSSGRVTHITTVGKNDPTWVSNDFSYCYAKYTGSDDCSTQKSDDTGVIQWSKDNCDCSDDAVSQYTIDSSNRLTKATNADQNDKDYNYAYNSNNDITSADDYSNGTDAFTYNSANQIATTSVTWHYDDGTSSTSSYPAPVYDGAGDQTANSWGDSYAYNSAGQLTGAPSETLAYAGADEQELLSTADHTYVYGRTDQAGNPAVQSFHYNDGTNTHAGYIERDNVGTPLGMDYDGRDYYFTPDGRGTITDLEDANTTWDEALYVQWDFDPYGEMVGGGGSVWNDGYWDDSLMDAYLSFAGGLVDEKSRLTKLGQRWYDPGQYQFIQQDSRNIVGDPAHGNRYAYAGDNPITYVDPTGQDWHHDVECGSSLLIAAGGVAAFGGAVLTAPATFGGSLVIAGAGLGSLGADGLALSACG